jgi:hypothetical protein
MRVGVFREIPVGREHGSGASAWPRIEKAAKKTPLDPDFV